MTNSKKSTTNKRKQNPMASNAVSRVPRNRVSFDGQIFKGVSHLPLVTTVLNLYSTVNAVACTNNANGVSASFAGMFNFYKEYKFLSLNMEWIPAVAPGVSDGGSEIIVAYNWNPEQIVSQAAALNSTVIANLRSDRTSRSFNAWERFNYNVPLHARRKMFDVDVNPGAYLTDVNQVDRAIQGAIVMGATSIGAAVTLGHFKATYSLMLQGAGIVST